MKLTALLITFLISVSSLFSQTSDPPRQLEEHFWEKFEYAKPSVRISLMGHQFIRPGASFGIEQPIWEKRIEKIKKRKGRIKYKYRFWFLTADVSAWVHPNSYSAQSLRVGALLRKVRNRGRKFEAGLSLGIVNRFNAGRTYTVKEDGEVNTRFIDNRIYFMPTLSLGFGKDHLYGKKSRPFAWHLRPTVSAWMPYNNSIVPTYGIEAGVSLYIKDFQPLKLLRRK